MPKISLSESDLIHLFELAYQNFQKGCPECKIVKKKVIKIIGKREADWVRRQVKKHPY
jgi:hypothetical protein